MKLIFSLLCLFNIIAQAQHTALGKLKSISIKHQSVPKHVQPNKLAFLDILPTDTLIVDKQLCVNHDLDSLCKEKSIYDLTLIDVNSNTTLIRWTSFLGTLNVAKLNDHSFSFNGSAQSPVNGDWSKPFERKKILKYVLQINEDSYKIYRDQSVQFKPSYSVSKTENLEKRIFSDTSCTSQNWDIAHDCFSQIEKYEFHLFALLLNEVYEQKENYIYLRDNISMVNAGQFSEYYEGNISLLALYGIIKPEEYNFISLTHNSSRSKSVYCY